MNTPSVALLGVLLATLTACQNASVANRDDGIAASKMRVTKVSPLYDAAVEKEAERLMGLNPALGRKDAFEQARKNVPVGQYQDTPDPAKVRKERQRKAQEAFEEDLAKSLRK